MKKDCDLFMDLLPLYKDDLLSEESRRYVETHCLNCVKCNTLFGTYDRNREFDKGEELKSYASFLKKQKVLSGFFFLYAFVLLIAYVSGAFFLNPDDTMGYVFLFFYFLLPVFSGISTAVYIYYSGIVGVFMGALMGYLNNLIPACVFHYEHAWHRPLEKESAIFYFPVIFGACVGFLLWGIKKVRGSLAVSNDQKEKNAM